MKISFRLPLSPVRGWGVIMVGNIVLFSFMFQAIWNSLEGYYLLVKINYFGGMGYNPLPPATRGNLTQFICYPFPCVT